MKFFQKPGKRVPKLEQLESREIPQSLMSMLGVGSMPVLGSLIEDFLPTGPSAMPADIQAWSNKTTNGSVGGDRVLRLSDSVLPSLKTALARSSQFGVIEGRAIRLTDLSTPTKAVSSEGDLLSLGGNLAGDTRGLASLSGARASIPAPAAPGAQVQSPAATSSATFT